MRLKGLVVILLTAGVMEAHHSIAAEFDTSKSVAVKGTVCSAEFSNPHSHLFVNVKADNGKAETWIIELSGTAQLKAAGVIVKDVFNTGDPIQIEAYPARTLAIPDAEATLFVGGCPTFLANVIRKGHAKELTLANGKQIRFDDANLAVTVVRQ